MASRFNMKGSLKVNLRRVGNKTPDFTGVMTIDETVFWVSGWRKRNPSTGGATLSLKLQNKAGSPGGSEAIKGGVITGPLGGQGEVALFPNGSLSGKIETDNGLSYAATGSFTESNIKITVTSEAGRIVIPVSIEKHDYELIESYAKQNQSSAEGVVNQMVRNLIAQLKSPKT